MQENAWSPGLGLAVVAYVGMSILALRAAPQERRAVLRIAALFALAVLGYAAAVALLAFGFEVPSVYARGIATLLAGVSFIQLGGVLVFRTFLPRLRLTPPRILQDVIVALAQVVWGLIRLHYTGVDLAGIITTSAVITAVIGFSLQDTLGNILGGLALQLDQTVKVGDWIALDEHAVGRVVEIRWRQTSLETRNWETVVVPNSVLMKNRFMVLGRRAGHPVQQRQWIPFNVPFEVSPSHVIETVDRTLQRADIRGVAKDPQPSCLLVDLTQSSAAYSVAYWLTDLGAKNPTDSEVRIHIHSALTRAGIRLAVPTQALTITERVADATSETAREQNLRLEALRRVDLFEGLTAAELALLAERLKPAPFSRGDVVTQQGTRADWLYILVSGSVDVFVENGEHERAKVAELGPGSVFGEMGLMTGEPRAATIVARTQVDSYRLDKESFRDLIASRPEVADHISALLTKRRAEIDATLRHLDEDAHAAWAASTHRDIRRRIRSFFGIKE